MSNRKHSIEDRLRLSPSLHSLTETLRECLSSGTLGKHMPRYYVPQKKMAEASNDMLSVITLAGIRDGKALFEIRPLPSAVGDFGGAPEFQRYRRGIQSQFMAKPWLRALVPLKGTVAGSVIQLRQTPTFRSAYVGFIYNHKIDRRGCFTRHIEHHDVSNGAVDSSMPAIRVVYADRASMYVAVPVDSFVTLTLKHTHDGVFEPFATAGVLVPSLTLSARRVERKQMREAATDYMSRVSAALAVLDMSGGFDIKTANALQDILGLTTYKPDYHFKTELEMASGRWPTTHGALYESEFSAAVLAGAMHAGARTELLSDNDAKIFTMAVKSFVSILRNKQDKVFQANTIFSSAPSPDTPEHYAKLHAIANGDIKSI
jgi:hypothetical protein